MKEYSQSELKALIEERLQKKMDELPPSKVRLAMAYSLMAGGKRLRPLFLLNVLKGYGKDPLIGLDAACAVEMVHTYSLIHDDLPAMDNDDYRRGNLTCHKKFDEATAILAGDALLTQAFLVCAGCTNNPKKNMAVSTILSYGAGAEGMILGQELDMLSESCRDLTLEDLKKIHLNKTGRLFSVPLMIGCILASRENEIAKWEKIGQHIGFAFQIQDDILDVVSSVKELGKSTSDQKNEKFTTVTLLGLEKAEELMKEEYGKAMELMEQCDFDCADFKKCLSELIDRRF